jgi:hypothetical protein
MLGPGVYFLSPFPMGPRGHRFRASRRVLGCLLGFLLTSGVRAALAQTSLAGAWTLVSDSDGASADTGTHITLTFSAGSVSFSAVGPGQNVADSGPWSVSGSRITLSLPGIGKSSNNQPYTIAGNSLTLPFKVFSGGGGTSSWIRVATPSQHSNSSVSGQGQGGGGNPGNSNNPRNPSQPGNSNNPGNTNKPGNSNNPNNGNNPNNPNPDNSDNPNNPNNPDNPDNPNKTNNAKNPPKPRPPQKHPAPLPPPNEMDKLAGVWQGWGASYEVRFRRQNIMSVAVKHSTLFTFVVDRYGNVKGTGVIVYDLDPNLCGLANLVKYTNMGINIMAQLPSFWNLSKTLGKAYSLVGETVATSTIEGASETGTEMAKEAAGELKEKTADFLIDQMKDVLKDKLKEAGAEMIKKMGEEDKTEEAQKEAAGCGSVQPGSLGQAAAQAGSSAIGGVPMVPGVTQVQYNYKGLEHGPEMRTYDFEGYVGYWDGETKIFLKQTGDVQGGPKNLTVVYQVNYKTDEGTFPAWSPFLENPGIVLNADSAHKAPDEVQKLAEKMGKSLPSANQGTAVYFQEHGTHRNHVAPWQEYEYEWSAQKINPSAASSATKQ